MKITIEIPDDYVPVYQRVLELHNADPTQPLLADIPAYLQWLELQKAKSWAKEAGIAIDSDNDGAEPSADVVPGELPLWKVRAILQLNGFKTTVDDFIAKIPDENTRIVAFEQWNFGNYVQRNHPIVEAAAAVLELTSEQIDEMFKAAARLA